MVEPVRPGAPPTARSGLIALGNGRHAVVGDLALVNGRYGTASDGIIRPLPAPVWTRTGESTTDEPGRADDRWEVDLRRGLLLRHHADGRRETRLVSLTRPSIGALRVDSPAHRSWPAPLAAPTHETLAAGFEYRTLRSDATSALGETLGDRCRIQVAAEQSAHHDDGVHRLDRIVAVGVSGTQPDAPLDDLAAATEVGFDILLREHTDAWAERWAAADIEIDGDTVDDTRLAIRFALFHLLSCAPTDGRSAAIGARGTTGLAYAGHVFWDTEVFVLPTLMATLPAAVPSVLAYRLERLPAARRHAAAMGHIGARMPWESADEGDDVTPTQAHTPEGGTVEILTGRAAEHITADVAWGAVRAAEWTGDRNIVEGPGRALVVETARYWTSRARIAADGSAHLDGVVGPDEYHELVDDNTYTDQMVRWHLLAAADLLDRTGDTTGDADRFRDLAARLPEERSRRGDHHEQFSGFDDLDASPIDDLPDRPIAADVWLGRDRIRLAQIMKQPDVLMLHHLVPDWCPPGWLVSDLDHDLPRTAHGSSLSPAICAALLARIGRPDEALHWFDIAARLDLDDLTGTTGEGLHLGTMGGLWQAVVWGFAGIRLVDDRLLVEPHLPSGWRRLVVRLVVRGRRLVVTLTHEGVEVDLDGVGVEVPVRLEPLATAERSTR